MSNQITFNQAKEMHLKTLELYVPVVARVHGTIHPEFHEVHALFDTMIVKIKKAGSTKPELSQEFIKLREITNDYTVPNDVCESYEAVYTMLQQLDKAYQG
jgi:iron-sulfur cluster repair protein YtfE (RIC family)